MLLGLRTKYLFNGKTCTWKLNCCSKKLPYSSFLLLLAKTHFLPSVWNDALFPSAVICSETAPCLWPPRSLLSPKLSIWVKKTHSQKFNYCFFLWLFAKKLKLSQESKITRFSSEVSQQETSCLKDYLFNTKKRTCKNYCSCLILFGKNCCRQKCLKLYTRFSSEMWLLGGKTIYLTQKMQNYKLN